jgi:Ca2+-binding EF-hand superfamily protein
MWAQLKDLFDATDTHGNGSVDAAEMKAFCAKLGVEASSFDEMRKVFANLVAGNEHM